MVHFNRSNTHLIGLLALILAVSGCSNKDLLGKSFASFASQPACRVTSKSVETLAEISPYFKNTVSTGTKFIRPEDRSYLAANTELTLKYFEDEGCPVIGYEKITLSQDKTFDQFENELQADLCIAGASLSQDVQLFFTPNDQLYGGSATSVSGQTHHAKINSEQAWDTFADPETGITKDVVVAILDTGVFKHEDLDLWVNAGETPGNGQDDDGNGRVDDVHGWNTYYNNSTYTPTGSSHGTHVAGLAGAKMNNTTGVAGVMGTHAKIMAVNVFTSDAQGASDASIAAGIKYAIDMKAKVINMSLGGGGELLGGKNAIGEAIAAGITVIVAAGNSSKDINFTKFYPAAYAPEFPGMLTVASTDTNMGPSTSTSLSGFSNFGAPFVGIAAPGSTSGLGGVLATVTNNGYARLQGTSMASPVVAGAAAAAIGLIESRGYTISPAQVVQLLKDSAAVWTSLQGKVAGNKHLDMAALANAINTQYPFQEEHEEPTPTPTPLPKTTLPVCR